MNLTNSTTSQLTQRQQQQQQYHHQQQQNLQELQQQLKQRLQAYGSNQNFFLNAAYDLNVYDSGNCNDIPITPTPLTRTTTALPALDESISATEQFLKHCMELYEQQDQATLPLNLYQQQQQQQQQQQKMSSLSSTSSSPGSTASLNHCYHMPTTTTALTLAGAAAYTNSLETQRHSISLTPLSMSSPPPLLATTSATQSSMQQHQQQQSSSLSMSTSTGTTSPTTTLQVRKDLTNATATVTTTVNNLLNLDTSNFNLQQPHNPHNLAIDISTQQLAALTTAPTTDIVTMPINTIVRKNDCTSTITGATVAGISSSSASPSVTSTTANSVNQQQQEQQRQRHHHQHTCCGGGGSLLFKSCWCFGESVCSGIEVEIENNNNNNHFHPGDQTYHMKILVPAVASGAIIGKGGETIASLQKDSGARVKMSKSHDFYPGTTERVCLITGSVEGIMSVLDFIMDKIREKPDLTVKIIDSESKQAQERDKQVKILVPNSTAGMIIGKGGAYIKQIKEESGSYVQISQKPKDISLQERCITIIGDKENNKNACKMILSKIVEDPQSGTCLNVSYADVNGPVANFNPTGSPYATNQNAINSSTASLNSTLGTAIGSAATAAGLLVNGTGINLSLNLSAPNPAPNLAIATQLLEHIKVAMRGSGYSETATTEVCAALGVLAKYGVLGMGVGVPHANGAHTTLGSYLGVSALDQQTAAAATAATAAGNVFGAVGQVNLDQYTAAAAAAAVAARPTQTQLNAAAAAAQFDPFGHLGTAAAAAAATQATTPVSLNNNSFGLTAATGTAGGTTAQTLGAATSLSGLSKSPTPGDLGAKDSKNVEIPEVIVGAILGPNGRSLVEIQHISGANVQISKKGIFAPGTRNRIVTITGQPSAIAKAQILIEQKINEEETKRARQIPLTTVVN